MMRQIDGARLRRCSLRLDAAYCALLGLAVAVFAGWIAEGVALSPILIGAAGVAVVVWAGGILLMLSRLPLRRALHLVMVANIVASIVVAFASVTAATLLVVAAVVTIAIDVALFATSQAVALRALPTDG